MDKDSVQTVETTYFDMLFDYDTLLSTVQCPGCGRRLRCSCPACMERTHETTNGPGLGFTVECDHEPLGEWQKCNDCGYADLIDNWSTRSEKEHAELDKYGELAESVIDE